MDEVDHGGVLPGLVDDSCSVISLATRLLPLPEAARIVEGIMGVSHSNWVFARAAVNLRRQATVLHCNVLSLAVQYGVRHGGQYRHPDV